ncbi:MAG: LPS export ABC transporter periplasmic protein LptC [Elusimicrobia bacterium]|nr:LPS export ABC transporter periplasmic protein LptC [Elusimicrobiota bacterium]
MGRPGRLLPQLIAPFLALIVAAGCRAAKRGGAAANAGPVEPVAELRMQGMTVQSWGINGMEWEMHAPTGEGFTQKNFIRVSSMSVQLFDRGKRSTQIAAQKAVMATGNPTATSAAPSDVGGGIVLAPGDMYMDGGVVVVSTEGSRVSTDWVKYTAKDQLIRSTAPVEVIRPDSITKGRGLEANSDLSHLKIFNQTLVIPGTEEKKK